MESICRSKQAPFLKTFSMINGKWKLRILYELACEKILRYSELKRNLTPITHKMLSTQLKELEEEINRFFKTYSSNENDLKVFKETILNIPLIQIYFEHKTYAINPIFLQIVF